MRRLIAATSVLFALAAPLPAASHAPDRVWIDTDAACGVSAQKDIDDCLALLMMLKADDIDIVGLSSVFGNAKRGRVDDVLAQFSDRAALSGLKLPTAVSGARSKGGCRKNAASAAIARALKDAPMTILLLGPATNLACALEADPALAKQITKVVAVMGARSGHVFHPAEGSPGAPLGGHGMIVRDLNAQLDSDAAEQILKTGVPVTLIPYEASRQITILQGDLDAFAGVGPVEADLAKAGRAWTGTWKMAFGVDGFYPFDAVAALYVIEPGTLNCEEAEARVEADRAISGSRSGPQRLLIGPLEWAGEAPRRVTWCNSVRPHAKAQLLLALGVAAEGGASAR
jgi:purine nucleosidase